MKNQPLSLWDRGLHGMENGRILIFQKYIDIKGVYFGAFFQCSLAETVALFLYTYSCALKFFLRGLFFPLTLLWVWWHPAVSRTSSLRSWVILQPCLQQPYWSYSPGLSSCKRLSPGSGACCVNTLLGRRGTAGEEGVHPTLLSASAFPGLPAGYKRVCSLSTEIINAGWK